MEDSNLRLAPPRRECCQTARTRRKEREKENKRTNKQTCPGAADCDIENPPRKSKRKLREMWLNRTTDLWISTPALSRSRFPNHAASPSLLHSDWDMYRVAKENYHNWNWANTSDTIKRAQYWEKNNVNRSDDIQAARFELAPKSNRHSLILKKAFESPFSMACQISPYLDVGPKLAVRSGRLWPRPLLRMKRRKEVSWGIWTPVPCPLDTWAARLPQRDVFSNRRPMVKSDSPG